MNGNFLTVGYWGLFDWHCRRTLWQRDNKFDEGIVWYVWEATYVYNKAHPMKKLFNLKIARGAPAIEHFNKMNTIVNQLVLVEIKFDEEVCDLIL